MDKTSFDRFFKDFMNNSSDKKTDPNTPFDHSTMSLLGNTLESINRPLHSRSTVIGESMMKLERRDITSAGRHIEISKGTLRKSAADVLDSSSSPKIETSSYTVRKQLSQSYHLETTSSFSKVQQPTSSENSLPEVASSLFPGRDSKRTLSMNINGRAEKAIDRLINHFDAPLYQHFFFLEEPEEPFPIIKNFKHLSLIPSTSIALDKSKTHLSPKVPTSKDGDTKKVNRSNSKIFKDLMSDPNQTLRKLWGQMPQVVSSGYLEKVSKAQRYILEAKFEIITSEASYYRSLLILESHFALRLTNVLNKIHYTYMFGLVKKIRKVSELVLKELSECFESSLMMSNMGQILCKLAKDKFSIFITFCKNQPLIETTFLEVKKMPQFEKALNNLELDPICQNLKLNSFLILPMQRFLRMPILVEAILKKLPPQDIEFKTWEKLLKYLKKKAEECNNACGELDLLAKQYIIIRDLAASLQFAQGIPPLGLQSSSRTLILQNNFSIIQIIEQVPSVIGIIRLTLLSDYLILAKPASNKQYQVITYCKKDKAYFKPSDKHISKKFLVLKITENYNGDAECWFLGSDSSKKLNELSNSWLEVLPHVPTEFVPITKNNMLDVNGQLVQAVYEYVPRESDEIAVKPGESVRIRSMTDDGWCLAERVRDSKVGYLPKNYTTLVSENELENTLDTEMV